MNADQAKQLRAPFDPKQIGKLPKPTKKDNPKGKCDFCGGWHGLPAVHLDYVGHAAVTDRLLQVDPDWSWEPMAVGPNGEPLFTNGGLWIKLTVAGVTRPGFGDESNGKGTKEVIGDAIRNAAMRFGVALDLWAKEDLRGDEDAAPALPPKREPTGRGVTQKAEAKPAFQAPDAARAAQAADEGKAAKPADVKKLRALAAKLVGEGKATQGQLDSASIQRYQRSFGAALDDPNVSAAFVADFLERLGNYDANTSKAQQEVGAAA